MAAVIDITIIKAFLWALILFYFDLIKYILDILIALLTYHNVGDLIYTPKFLIVLSLGIIELISVSAFVKHFKKR